MTENFTWPEVLGRLLAEFDLSEAEARWAMEQLMSGNASPAQIAGFLVALRAKGPTGPEIAEFVDVMLTHAARVSLDANTVDTCGTGGDHSGSVNISTMAAIAVAATGVPVVKHGNRSASSKSGSADVLEALGIRLQSTPEQVVEAVDQVGIAFLFAPVFHPAMKYAGPVRKELGIPTVFNVLGPLANPAGPRAQVVGVADPALAPRVAVALEQRGTAAFVVRAEDGMDELTTTGNTRIWDCRTPHLTETVLSPADVGLDSAPAGVLDGGDAAENASIAEDALSASPSQAGRYVRDAVVLNAAAARVCHESVDGADTTGLVEDLRAAVALVNAALNAGEGTRVLERWRSWSAAQG